MLAFFERHSDIAGESLARLVLEYAVFFRWFTAVSRIFIAFLSVAIIARIAMSLFRGKKEPETWGYFNLPNGLSLPVNHWENLIGRAKSCDIVLNFPTVSRSHAAFIRRDDGRWRIIDLDSKTGISVNDAKVSGEAVVSFNDIIDIGGVKVQLRSLTPAERMMSEMREVPGKEFNPALTTYLLTVLNVLLCLQLCFANPSRFALVVPITFTLMISVIWAYYFFAKTVHRSGFEIEQTAFFLSSVGFSVLASSNPGVLFKQFAAMVIGLVLFLTLGWFLRDLKRANAMRWPMAAAAVGLLLFTILAGSVVYGSQRWVYIGGFSIQPSEPAKLCYIYAGTATLDRLFAKRNLILYAALTVFVGGVLAYISDFGSASIFFVSFLVIAFMRSGDVAALSLMGLAAVLGGFMTLRFKPYIAHRFAGWRNVWDFPHDGGFQQTRTMSASASGGFFGVGAGNGWLKNIFAADADLVFGIVAEELGLIVGICCVAGIVVPALFAFSSASRGRSTFYSIAGCAAASLLVFQMMLNVLGSVDVLPLTGVTFPFVSHGGSSIMSCFGILAFIKAADTRRLASFAVKSESLLFGKGKST